MDERPNRFELIGYLQEALPPEEMTRVEDCLRASEEWREALLEIQDEVDLGEHSVAMVWRRNRLTCLSREKLWAHLIGGLIPEEEQYVRFHLETVKCRWCLANLEDVRSSTKEAPSESDAKRRRRRIFETSVGELRKRRS